MPEKPETCVRCEGRGWHIEGAIIRPCFDIRIKCRFGSVDVPAARAEIMHAVRCHKGLLAAACKGTDTLRSIMNTHEMPHSEIVSVNDVLNELKHEIFKAQGL